MFLDEGLQKTDGLFVIPRLHMKLGKSRDGFFGSWFCSENGLVYLGRLVAIAWAYDYRAERHYSNHVTVSHDNGWTWSAPIDTGHMGQASNLMWLGGDHLLSIHAHRGEESGIYVRLVDFTGDRWRMVEETVIYGAGAAQQSRPGQSMPRMFVSLRFGQPSLVRLGNGEILATHWAIEEGQGRIRTHRLRLQGETA